MGVYSLELKARSGAQLNPDIQRARKLREGDRATVFQSVRSRFVGSAVSGANATDDYEVSERDFLLLNEIGPILDTRVREMPDAWDFKPIEEADQAFADELNAWAGTTGNGSDDLFAASAEVYADQEDDGVAALVLGGTREDVWVEVRDACQLEYQTDPMHARKLREVSFTWEEKGDGQDPKVYRETFTLESRTLELDGKPLAVEPNTIGMIPVVLIPRKKVKGKLTATPGAFDLEEAQAAYHWSLHLLNVANKFCAAPVLCPDPASDDGGMISSSGTVAQSFRVSPATFIPVPVKAITGPISDTLNDQVAATLESLRRQGFVREKGSGEADARSGKAMLVGSEAMRAYISSKVSLVKRGLREAATIWGRLTGRLDLDEEAPVYAEFGSVDDDDSAEVTKRGDLMLKAAVGGKLPTREFLSQWQRLGMLDEDADVEALADEIDQAEEEAAAALSERMKALQDRPGAPGEDQPAGEPVEQPPQGVTDGDA